MSYTLNKAKILIVDDMKPMLALTQSVLKIFGFKNVFVAGGGEEAFEIVCKEDPDIVITDWMMSPMDGLELASVIRRNPAAPNPYVPIIMMTGFSSRLRVENARDKGITEFLVKPFSSQDLYKRVVQIIERPRQFVDSGTFFGPDRRRKASADYKGPRRRGKEEKEEENNTPKTEEQKRAANILKKLHEETKNISN
ncbi:MAG: response regulator [Alphaproteobacteria bacterium]|nr:response regulator [Alphaproteobacteria bacterium]